MITHPILRPRYRAMRPNRYASPIASDDYQPHAIRDAITKAFLSHNLDNSEAQEPCKFLIFERFCYFAALFGRPACLCTASPAKYSSIESATAVIVRFRHELDFKFDSSLLLEINAISKRTAGTSVASNTLRSPLR